MLFRSLTHLRLSGNRNPHGLLQLGALAAAAPALTNLRLSDLACAAPFAREMHTATLPGDGPAASPSSENPAPAPVPVPMPVSPFVGALPARLKHVRVDLRRLQPRVHAKGLPTRGMQSAQEKMLALFHEIELRRADTRLESFSVVEGDGWEMYDELRREWLEGMPDAEW